MPEEELELNEEQKTEYEKLETPEAKAEFLDKIKLDLEEISDPAQKPKEENLEEISDPAQKPKEEENQKKDPYRTFENKDDYTKTINNKTKKIKLALKTANEKIEQQQKEIDDLKQEADIQKTKTRVVFVNKKPTKTKTKKIIPGVA